MSVARPRYLALDDAGANAIDVGEREAREGRANQCTAAGVVEMMIRRSPDGGTSNQRIRNKRRK